MLRRIARDESGQSLAEYAVLVFFLVIGFLLATKGMLEGVRQFFIQLASQLTLPIP